MNIPEGWQLVPVEPTEEMFNARYSIPMDEKTPQGEWEAMLQAAPTPPAQEAGTSAAKWRESGEPDPHGKQYDCERAALCMGNLTDDELANAVFLHGNEKPDIQAVMRGEAYMPLSYLTAAKDRIRWLSRKVEELASKAAPAQEADANVCTSTSPDAHKTGNIDDKQEINYALISKHRELGWTVSDSVYKAHIAQVLPLQKQPEVTVTTAAQEAEPYAYAYAYKSSSDPRPSVYFEKMDFFPPSIQEIPLYTHPANDDLREAEPVAIPADEQLEDVLLPLMRKHLTAQAVRQLTHASWKDGIDIERVDTDMMQLVKKVLALYTHAPSDKLRQVAEEAEQLMRGANLIVIADMLRDALEGKS